MSPILVDPKKIAEAKEKLAYENFTYIMEYLGVTDYDSQRMRCCCPFHDEDTPSFIFNPKEWNCRCFGACAQSYDIIDAYMKGKNASFAEAVQNLFELAQVNYGLGMIGVKTKHQYRYPKPVECTDKSKVYAYLATRKIRDRKSVV